MNTDTTSKPPADSNQTTDRVGVGRSDLLAHIDEVYGLDLIEERWKTHGYTIESAMQAKAAYEEWAQEDVHFDCLDAAILGTNAGGLFPARLESFFAAWIRSANA